MSLLLASSLLLSAQGAEMTFISTGTSKNGYTPIRAEMMPAYEAGLIKKAPADLKAPLYGVIKFEPNTWAFILDEPEGGTPRLFVDSNANGDLTDDPAISWIGVKQGEFMLYRGNATIMMGGNEAGIGVYRFDKNDPSRAQLKNTLLYYSDFGYKGKLQFGEKVYPFQFAGALSPASRIWVDRNGNGKSDGRSESISASKPFNFDGTTYELKIAGNSLSVAKSSKSVEEYPLPPDLSVGAIVPSFEMAATDGSKVNFPKSYAGKIVMLDFWATWCGPCIAELPTVLKAYEKFHDRGFEILGVSFDQANAEKKLADFTKEHNMPWKQLYEGKYWDTKIGLMYGVEGIPFALIVDGDTGRILANSPRGPALDKALEAAFAARASGGSAKGGGGR